MRELQKKIEMKAAARNLQVLSHELDVPRTDVVPPGWEVASVLELTEDSLRRSGIVRGMRVLDLGCGSGETSLRIAKLVGPSGLVVGIDQSAEAIDLAERRATLAGSCYWTRFVAADPGRFISHTTFDAAVVRLMSSRQRGTAVISLQLSTCVRPGGLIVLVSGNQAKTGSLGRIC